MVKYLLGRPVSVFVTFGMFVLLGILAYTKLPTSLLPDIPVPEVIVRLSGPGFSAQELERVGVSPLRMQLAQLSHLQDIRSESEDGQALIRLRFNYGTRMDLAFIEANEKVDAAMGFFPPGMSRPTVLKVNTTDLPVFDLVLTLRDDSLGQEEEERFFRLCDLAQNVIKRRLEQLPEVSLVDMTGLWTRELVIRPSLRQMQSLGITEGDLENAFLANNIEVGSATVRDGNYEYKIRFAMALRSLRDVEDIRIHHGGRIFRLGDLAEVRFGAAERKGEVFFNGKRALVLSVVKRSDAKMDDLQDQVKQSVDVFRAQYSGLDIVQTHDQSRLLDMTLGNLRENLLLGMMLVLLVTIYFLRDVRMPFVIGLSLVSSLIISFGLFYVFRISLNMVSVAGLIFSTGMMIDNSIVVTDGISQYRQAGLSLDQACVQGTTEVITPMLSSMLTTIVIFVPLVFLSGMAGAVFYDQALSIALSLVVSYVVAITFLPVFYKLCFLPSDRRFSADNEGSKPKAARGSWLFRFYDWGIALVFRHPKPVFAAVLVFFSLCFLFWKLLDVEKMPPVRQNEAIVSVDWNENIHVGENVLRSNRLVSALDGRLEESLLLAGSQQFLIGRGRAQSTNQSRFYIKVVSPDSLPLVRGQIAEYMACNHPRAVWSFDPPRTAFDEIFSTDDPDFVMELYPRGGFDRISVDSLFLLRAHIAQRLGEDITAVPRTKCVVIRLLPDRLAQYQVSSQEIVAILKNCFGENRFGTLRNFTQYIPVRMDRMQYAVEEILAKELVRGKYPLGYFVAVDEHMERKFVMANANGEYLPLTVSHLKDSKVAEPRAKALLRSLSGWDYSLSGNFFQSQELMSELTLVLLVSLVMMYLILTAQFGSFLLPLILLIEIPIDVAAALACLYFFGHTLNLMSVIGIIVACGIVINDSILKLDVMDTLRLQGTPVHEAIHEAGRRRLRSMVMTSLTSIVGFVPIFFSEDMGSTLQRPLVIAMVGAMSVGTLVSLFLIPLLYSFVYREDKPQK